MRKLLLPVFFFFVTTAAAQDPVRVMEAVRAAIAPAIDGDLDDSCWSKAPHTERFIQNAPVPGNPSSFDEDVRVVYDDNAIYIGARLYDPSPDSILHQLSARDDYQGNSDAFGVMLDTYHDRRNAFFFAVTAAGVQADSRYTFDTEDLSLNSVWYSKTKVDAKGWTVEMKIPYQAIRFRNGDDQLWGLNFTRIIRRYREQSWWNFVDPNVTGVVNQCGDLAGINNIVAPVRLALLPYVSAYAENYAGRNAYSLNGGMDIKYGINESFTLDMTLIPDFGQTQSDNVVLNLSPFEVKFDERRYFFTEGTDLFNKNDLFYSRRIGAAPPGYSTVSNQLDTSEIVYDNPEVTRLYNAVKISGRTKNKTGIGFLNAVSAPAYATLRDTVTGDLRRVETAVLTNYNVLVIDQVLPHNSYIGFLNTSVMRNGNARDADVSSVQFRAGDRRNVFAVDGYTDVSNVWNAGSAKPSTGYRYNFTAGKVSGKYTAIARYKVISQNFDSNDLGYLDLRNNMDFGLQQNYNIHTPVGRILWQLHRLDLDLGVFYNPRHYTFFTITGRHIFTFRNWMSVGVNWLANPIYSYDYYETRTPGRYLLYPKNYQLSGFLSSDYRKKLALDLTAAYRIFLQRNRTIASYSVAPRWRVNNKLLIVYSWAQELKNDNVGFVANRNDSLFFGLRNLNTVTNTLTLDYIFTNTMGLSLRVRHYWSQADYKGYYLLNANGQTQDAYYNGDADVRFNAFNVDMVFTWQFFPGSELSVVWKNAILTTDNLLKANYAEDARDVFDSPQSNSLSAKLIWYIDAGKWFRRK
ncbi:MAG TPA: DUF5916 domain-containing protein [Bacteroidia bacterium]|nr:DUF5916 domain-containing protein [Bacteroidia bacterium]